MGKNENKTLDPFESFDAFFQQVEARPEYWEERAKLEFTREVVDKMGEANVSKGELASRLEVWPGMVTRLLSGRNNFELNTMVRIAMALNCRFKTHLEPIGAKTVWFDVYDTQQEPQNLAPWRPDEFRSIQLFIPACERLNYEPFATPA